MRWLEQLLSNGVSQLDVAGHEPPAGGSLLHRACDLDQQRFVCLVRISYPPELRSQFHCGAAPYCSVEYSRQ
jgi:hypothetical protein